MDASPKTPPMSATMLYNAIPMIPALDVPATVAAMQEKLGFEKLFAWGEPIAYAGLKRGHVEVHVCPCDDPKIVEWTSCRIQVRGIEPLYAEMQAAGVVHPNGALADKPWGWREFAVLVPGGVCIHFGEIIPDAP